MILKVHIHTLDNEAELELKKDQGLYRLLIIKSRSDYDKNPGAVWHGESGDEETVEGIGLLIAECHRSPHKPERITILDGMRVTVNYLHGETELPFSFKEFEEGSNEVLLLRKLFTFCKHVIRDEAFDRYVSSIEAYVR